jgi:hypothetical protein
MTLFKVRTTNGVSVSRFLWPSRKVTLCVLAFRLANSCILQTSFEPDEYWQSLEVAHHMVFGYGHLTWEWIEGIRGYTHPLLFTAVYWLLRIFGLDNGFSLVGGLIPYLHIQQLGHSFNCVQTLV